MLLWDSACVVHEEFKASGLRDLKKLHPDAGVLVHPESPSEVISLADAVGSTSHLIKASQELSFNKFIVIKDSKIGPELKWVQIGKSDLTNVEVINGLDKGDQVFVLPSQSLVDYQEKFRARVSSSFGA